MKALHNIEKSGFHKGQYVGYSAGVCFRIKKTNSSYGNWVASTQAPTVAPHAPDIYAFTLAEMSAKLEARAAK